MTPERGRPLPGQASGHLLLTPEPQGQLVTASHCRQAARPHSEVFWNGGRQSSLTESQEAQGFPHSNVCCSGLGAGGLPQGQNQPRGFQPICGEHPRVWKEHQAEKGHRLLGSLFLICERGAWTKSSLGGPTRTSYSSSVAGGREPFKWMVVTLAPKAERKSGGGGAGNCSLSFSERQCKKHSNYIFLFQRVV